MTKDRIRVFEGTYVPATFEKLLVPTGEDPDGLGPLSDRERILRRHFQEACNGKPELFKSLAKQLYDHQKFQLKNTHVIANGEGEPADNMDLEDICAVLDILSVLTPNNPSHVFSEGVQASRYSIASWVFERGEMEGVFVELIEAVRRWNDAGALETTVYPGAMAIDGDGKYPIFVPVQDKWTDELKRQLEILQRDLPPEFAAMDSEPPARTQSRTFIDCQWPKGHCPNKAGRPRRPRETEDLDEERPFFFDMLMPADGNGNQVTFGEEVFRRAKNHAVKESDWEWLSQMNGWAAELKQLRDRRPRFRNEGFVYDDKLEVTRIDIAIRHLSIADVQWRKQPAARWKIKPWLVSAALERKKKGSVTRKNMEVIYVRTQTAQHVDWPKWWPDELRGKHNTNPNLKRPRRKISGTLTKP